MKINLKLIKCLIILFLFSNEFENFKANCLQSKLTAAFKSNFKMMFDKKKSNRRLIKDENGNDIPDAPVATDLVNPSGTSGQESSTPSQGNSSKKPLIPNIPVLYQTWAKYFNYKSNETSKPSNFFVNDDYDKQSINQKESPSKDNHGFTSIKGDLYFYLVVYQDSIQFYTSRQDVTAKLHDVISIDFINAIPEDKPYAGGILNYGEVKEGSCLQIKTITPLQFFQPSEQNIHPVGIDTVWFLCLDEKKDKEFLMELLINMKIQKQHNIGVYMTFSKQEEETKIKGTSGVSSMGSTRSSTTEIGVTYDEALSSVETEVNDAKRSPIDGYWKVLQGWSSCTLKCGGGTQTLQLLCVPPKLNGKKCIGEAIRVKQCNKQPCPEIQDLRPFLQTGNEVSSKNTGGLGEKIEKPIVRVMSISTKPQRYDKCYMKDGDALMETNDKETGRVINLPVRIVMNNKSFAIFTDDTLQSNVKSFLLENTIFTRVKDSTTCFFLKGLNQQVKFCQLDSLTDAFVDEWGYDFNLFKHQCRQARKTASFETEKLESEYKEGVTKLKQEIINKRITQTKKEVVKSEEKMIQVKIDQTEKLSLDAIQKELKMEEMLEKEEEEKDKEEENELEIQVESEKKKQDCLLKGIQQKQIEDQMNIQKLEADEKIQQIQQKARQEIIINRQKMTQKLKDMKVRKDRKKQELQKQIMHIRVDMTKNFHKMQKKDPTNQCNTYLTDDQKKNFCTNKVDVDDQIECINSMNNKGSNGNRMFCEYCCEYNIGTAHEMERAECRNNVCKDIKEN